MRNILSIHRAGEPHWVGDGFPVQTVFSYNDERLVEALSPFLLLDHAGPASFTPTGKPRGVGMHPHRGFETVTIVYQGEVAHHDSTGSGGVIGPGDVQWMTAASGIVHEEFHSPNFTLHGGMLHMAQLWVNLPAHDKMAPPRYQTVLNDTIPTVLLSEDSGTLRVIAGDYTGYHGPAQTFTPINVWDLRLNPRHRVVLDLPEGHTSLLVVLQGRVRVNGVEQAEATELVMFERTGGGIGLEADADADVICLLLTGEPIPEPIVGYGPFVMNSTEEIRKAFVDYQNGQFGDPSSQP